MCLSFGESLPRLRAQVENDLANPRPGKAAVAAAVVRLLDLGKVRVGNAAYRKTNKSFGATTLLDRHAKVGAGRVRLESVGQSGTLHRVTIADRRLASTEEH